MLPVNIIMPEDKEQLALTINGKKRNIHKKEFRLLAEACGLTEKTVKHIWDKMCALQDKLMEAVENSYLSELQKNETKTLILEGWKC